MKYIDKLISKSYYQVYCIIDASEKKKYYKEVRELAFHDEKDLLLDKLSVYKKINKNSGNDKNKEKLQNISDRLAKLSPNTIELDRDDLVDYLTDVISESFYNHLDKIGILQVFDSDVTMLGDINDNSSLTLIYSFCYISLDYDLKLPTRKGNPYIFTKVDLDMLKTEILLGCGYFKRVETDKVTEFSDIVFDYVRNDTKQTDVTMDVRRMEIEFDATSEDILNLKMGENIIEPNYLDSEDVIINVKKIYNKKVSKFTDAIVRKLGVFDLSTVKELDEKITEVFAFTLNVNNNLMDLTEQLANANELEIDSKVIRHFVMYMGKKDTDIHPDKLINDIKTSFLTMLIFKLNPDIDIDKYIFYMGDEYVFVKLMKKAIGDNSMEDYFMMKAPLYAAYEFFRKKNLVTERR